MDLLYMISRKYGGKVQFYNDFMDVDEEVKGLIRISQCNIVAWVTKYELNDSTDLSLGSRVYVADLNMPWNFHKITSNDNMITLLEWDLCGENLLIGDDSGTISIWSYRDYIFNDWTCIGTVNLLGEYMIGGIFFHSGRKISLNTEKKDNSHYFEKFGHVRYSPTVRVLGGSALDGCLVVTSTGLVVACIMIGDSTTPLLTLTESISSVRYKISVIDIAYNKNGSLIVATSCGSFKMPIKCYEISINYTNKKNCSITSQPLAGFFVDSSIFENVNQNWTISHIKFVVKDSSDSLIVVANNNASSVIQLWDLTESGTCHMSHMFNETSINGDSFKTLAWKCHASVPVDSSVVSVSSSKLLLSSASNAACYVMLAFKNNKIRVLSRSLKDESSYNLDLFWDTKDMKKMFNNICIADIDISVMGNVLVVLDNIGNFYVLQVQNIAELNGPLTVSYATTLLEYCLVSGYDFWDVAISLKPPILDAVCERFTENFNKQLPAVQQLEYGGYLSMKAFLYRLSSNSSQKHSDLIFLLTLHSISVAFKSLLRPNELTNSDKGPGESLSAVLSEPISDINSIIVKIEPKEFTVEPSILQSMQQLIQWVAHLALNILGRIPDHHKISGYDIVADNHALNILREVLVIIRIWGFLRPSCLPVFVRNVGNFEGLTTLFRLISRLIQCNQSNEIDENFIDECYLLQNQVHIPTLTSTPTEICDIASPAFHRQSLPLHFTFGYEPDTIAYEMETFTLDGSSQTAQNSDIIRHVYLGESNPHKVKQCNRCQGKTQIVNVCKNVAIRSWENRWIRSCLCGGKWRFIKTIKSPYSSFKII